MGILLLRLTNNGILGGMRYLFFILAFLLIAPTTHAQILPSTTGSQSHSFSLIPEFPRPYETVRVQIETFSFDIHSADVKWYVNGEIVTEGVGLNEVSFKTKGIETLTTVRVLATFGGKVLDKNISFYPSAVDVIQEPQTYTPSWYKGGSLPVDGATVRFIAIPYVYNAVQKRPYRSDELSFEWRVDGSLAQTGTRLGADTFTTKATEFRPNNITVYISPKGSSRVIGSGNSYLETIRPFVSIYTEDPLLGILPTSYIGSQFRFKKTEAILVAEPFYFLGKTNREAPLRSFIWKLDGKETATGDTVPWKITLRGAGKGGGSLTTELEVADENSFFGRATKKFTLYFNQ